MSTPKPLVPMPITAIDGSQPSAPPASAAAPAGSVAAPSGAPPMSGAVPAGSRFSPASELSGSEGSEGSDARSAAPAAFAAAAVPTRDFPDERPASSFLGSAEARAEWERRAEWLEAEAKAQPDAAMRSRLLLGASEVRALLGANAEARRLADQAAHHSPAPNFATRQARALALSQGDVGAVLRSLQEEARAARVPASRAHAYYMSAELLRLLRRDDGETEQRLEAAEQSDPSDHRATLQRLARQLAHSQRPPDVRFRPDETLKPLRQATGQLRQLRGSEAPRLGPHDLAAQPLVETQRALGRGRLAEAADALGQLEAQAGLGAAVRWLTTLWRVVPKDQPEETLRALQRLAQDHPGRLELRTWAARALAARAWESLRAALAVDTNQGGNAFSSEERAALAALAQPGEIAVQVDSSGAEPTRTALRLAEQRLAEGTDKSSEALAPNEPGAGAAPAASVSAAEFALGRALTPAQPPGDASALLAALPDGPWPSAARLQRSQRAGDLAALARELPRSVTRPRDHADSQFIAGVLAEKAGDGLQAAEHYRAALLSPSVREAALRALGPTGSDAAAMFRALSAQTNDGTRRSLLLTEALLHMDVDAPEFDAVSEEAWRADPSLPLAGDLAEVAARMRGDKSRLGRWLGRQREQARGAEEIALTTIREARFLALGDPSAAAERLRELLAPGSTDLGLARQIEQLVPGSAAERAQLRQRAAAVSSARGRAQLLAEASELYHDHGDTAAALSVARELGAALGPLRVEAWATDPSDLAWLASVWARELESVTDPRLALEIEERLARLEQTRGETELAASWRRKLLERPALPLRTLRLLEVESMRAGRERELEAISERLAEQLDPADAFGPTFLAARLKLDRGAFAEAGRLAERASSEARPPLWALRLGSSYARSIDDDRKLLACSRELRERARQPLDAATLSLRAAEAAARLGELALATAELERALEIAPEHVVALSARAELLESQGKAAEAADAFETLAATTQSPARRVEALYRAVLLWSDRLGDPERALAILDEAVAVGIPHAGVLERSRALHPVSVSPAPVPGADPADPVFGAAAAVPPPLPAQPVHAMPPALPADPAEPEPAPLVQAALPLQAVSAPLAQAAPRAEGAVVPDASKELELIRELRRAGQLALARERTELLLAQEPENADALHLCAVLLAESGDGRAAASIWSELAGTPLPRAQRLAVLAGLAALYEGELADPERARRVLQELLREDPDDSAARLRLVAHLRAAELMQDALEHQRELVHRAPTDEARRDALLELIPLLEHARDGQREAEALLEQAHRTWPDSPLVLTAQVEHYRRAGNANTARVLLERASHAARNAVHAGRLEPSLFRMLEQAARLSGELENARAAQAALAALEGDVFRVSGAGAQAGQQRFDDLIAPAPFSSGFRRLLYGAGAAIERAYAPDPLSLALTPLPDAQATQVRAVAAAFGLDNVRAAVSDQVGCDCTVLFGEPLTVIFGQQLLAHDNPRVRDFLLLRALKIAQLNACALSRMSATELWSAVAGFLACFSPPWQAEGQDAQRLIAARNRIRPHVTATLSRELAAMTAALTSNIVPQAAQVGDAIWRWASRVALFGAGELGVAIEALWAVSQSRPSMPRDIDARIRWIAGSSPARDLVGYGISEAYTEARRRAGLVPTPR